MRIPTFKQMPVHNTLFAQAHLYGQIGGVEHEEVPIICASTACRRIAELYQGKKYLICQNGYDRAETYAKENNIPFVAE